MAIKDVILALGSLLIAAAIAACFTVMTEWMHAAYFKSSIKLKAELRSGLGRDSEGARAAVATTTPAVTAFLHESPFARWSGLLYLPEPVGSEFAAAWPSIIYAYRTTFRWFRRRHIAARESAF